MRRSVIVSGQGAVDRCAGVVVVPDRGGEGEDALQDADQDSGGGVAAVAFEVELGFERLIDRLIVWRNGLNSGAPGRWGSPCELGAAGAGARTSTRGWPTSRSCSRFPSSSEGPCKRFATVSVRI